MNRTTPELAMQYAIAPAPGSRTAPARGIGATHTEQMKREIVRRYRTEQERAEREALGRQRRLLAAERKQLMAQAETWFITLIALTILAIIFGGLGLAAAGVIALLAWFGAALRLITIANRVATLGSEPSEPSAVSGQRSDDPARSSKLKAHGGERSEPS